MSQHTQKCEVNAIFKQNYALEIFTAFKMVYSCSFSLVENLDYLDFLQNCFITSTTGADVINEF